MPFKREKYAKQIADDLHRVSSMLKTRSRARFTDANHSLETVMLRFFNALYGWSLINLNQGQGDFPAADLGDRKRRVAIQITNEKSGVKITETGAKAHVHDLGEDFDRLIIFFLLEKKSGIPKKFRQPPNRPKIETQDITGLLKSMLETDVKALERAAAVLEEEIGGGISPEPLASYFKALRENFSTYENLGLPPPANADGEIDKPLAIRDLFVQPKSPSEARQSTGRAGWRLRRKSSLEMFSCRNLRRLSGLATERVKVSQQLTPVEDRKSSKVIKIVTSDSASRQCTVRKVSAGPPAKLLRSHCPPLVTAYFAAYIVSSFSRVNANAAELEI